ncbi:hypothetical protein TNCV_1063131 [Trichonephila clavipes]|nr:hypothetical protein TNCV_1063131 [Trichonephila clavipes]
MKYRAFLSGHSLDTCIATETEGSESRIHGRQGISSSPEATDDPPCRRADSMARQPRVGLDLLKKPFPGQPSSC